MQMLWLASPAAANILLIPEHLRSQHLCARSLTAATLELPSANRRQLGLDRRAPLMIRATQSQGRLDLTQPSQCSHHGFLTRLVAHPASGHRKRPK